MYGVLAECYFQMRRTNKAETEEQFERDLLDELTVWHSRFLQLFQGYLHEKVGFKGRNWDRLWKKFILLYTLETWLYPALNKASRDKDQSKILTLGPFACALYWALTTAEEAKPLSKEMSLPFVVHRGLSLNQETLDDYKAIVGKPFNLAGNQSTSVSESVAKSFLPPNAQTNTNIPVFQHLTIRSK